MADFIRIEKLYEHGGIWIDSDILFRERISKIFSKDELNFDEIIKICNGWEKDPKIIKEYLNI